jgi:hypothetical protein
MYLRRRSKLLLWSSGSFALLSVNNVLLFVDLILVENFDLGMIRALAAFAAVIVLLYGLVTENGG